MITRYNQWKAAWAISRASLIAMFRSPTSVVFSLLFPVIFVVVFGAMVNTSAVHIRVETSPGSDTANILYRKAEIIPVIDLQAGKDSLGMINDLEKGRIAAILVIHHSKNRISPDLPLPAYSIVLETAPSSISQLPILRSIFGQLADHYNRKTLPNSPEPAQVSFLEIPGRVYRRIDFILPGQLGFSLLMAGVFGSAFLLFHLRQSNVLKRMSATPVRRSYLILGEMLSRFFFQVISFVIIVSIGYFGFHFTLVNGLYTFLEMLLVSVIGLIIFMGTGFIISGLVHSESAIAPVANTVSLPQILLCGLFFPIANYPHWLQWVCRLLPLTFFVDSMRKIAFEGLHFWQIPAQLSGLLIWAILISWLAVRSFKWE
ncbi:MAG TPA: ABC transporter permease [Chitinophagaceae bacterium]|nr:ABC transporter permease [Chitinophagaceae bacterium]